MDTIMQPPQWPLALSSFVTWCLMWDPKNRPTSFQALQHEYFADAIDPLTRPKSSTTSRLLSRKQSGYETKSREHIEAPSLSQRSSWFRKSLIGRESAPVVPQHSTNPQLASPGPSPNNQQSASTVTSPKARPTNPKRATWSNGPTSALAPMPILPSIRPISPLSNAVTAQARSTSNTREAKQTHTPDKSSKKIGRQLSLASHGNHYSDLQAERERTGSGLMSPSNGQKEGFFSHLRKRARRLSGRNQLGQSARSDDVEANAGRGQVSNRSSMVVDQTQAEMEAKNDYTDLDRALQNVQYSLDASAHAEQLHQQNQNQASAPTASSVLKRHSSLSQVQSSRPADESPSPSAGSNAGPGPISSRTRRAVHRTSQPPNKYGTLDEEEELLDEALHGASRAATGLNRPVRTESINRNALSTKDINRQSLTKSMSVGSLINPYPTPSPSSKRNGVLFNKNNQLDEPATPVNITKQRPKDNSSTGWPTPPYEENEWANSASASIFAAGSIYR